MLSTHVEASKEHRYLGNGLESIQILVHLLSLSSAPRNVETVPVKWLDASCSEVRSRSPPSSDGIVPLSRFLSVILTSVTRQKIIVSQSP
jgi:hypothetical protein